MKKIFLVGFNKCGTRSFTHFFRRNGLRTCHWKAQGQTQTIAERIISNISITKDPLDGINDYTVYTDLTSLNRKCFIDIPAILPFLTESYPDAYYIFQHRSIERWIESRLNHSRFYSRFSKVFSQSDKEAIKTSWRDQFNSYRNYVRNRLAGHNYMEFQLETAPLQELTSFLAASYSLDSSHWAHKGETTNVQQQDGSAA